ncbi:uncharacterized protein LOC109842495 [Asparagus officinalis]|uniref:uncharacterized protein LOC109842495 n=1 Tax=Asparagus officinalis TaxID=4686 RepID=UPI00098E2E13|nr:uncharacterized protein LOC109842495 [Asparagus officinalis]
MAHQLHTNSLPTLHASSMYPASQIPSTSLKLKTLVQSYIFQQVGRRVIRALAYAKSLFDLLNTKVVDDNNKGYKVELERRKKRRRRRKEISHVIKMCCIMSSSHVTPMSEPESQACYDSSRNSVVLNDRTGGTDDMDGYLQWLEEKEHGNDDEDDGASENNIDQLAEKFIEKCHEKFRLEKQESYRRYQEMLARKVGG